MSSGGVAVHHSACPQAYHPYHPQHQQPQQQQQHPMSWPEHFQQHPATAPAAAPAHADQPFRPEWSAAAVRPGVPAFHAHYAPGGEQCYHHPHPASDVQSLVSFPYLSAPASAAPQHATIPSPPPSDGSPRTEWAYCGGGAERDAKGPSARSGFQIPFNRNSPVLRPDGIRKKNAKFEIPEERTLGTLDDLIKNAQDEPERKELKMQKRLLRNREAALHSRQKKKTHTEYLEREKEKLLSRIAEYQHQITALQIQVDDHNKERDGWQEQLAEAEERVRRLLRDQESQTKDNLRLSSDLGQLRAQVRAGDASPAVASTAAAAAAAGSTPAAPGAGSYGEGAVYPGGEWADSASAYDFIGDMCLEPGNMQRRGDDSRVDVVVH